MNYVPFFDYKDPKASKEKTLLKLKQLLKEHKGKYAGMTFELIQGEGGYYKGEREFFISLMNHLKENKIAINAN